MTNMKVSNVFNIPEHPRWISKVPDTDHRPDLRPPSALWPPPSRLAALLRTFADTMTLLYVHSLFHLPATLSPELVRLYLSSLRRRSRLQARFHLLNTGRCLPPPLPVHMLVRYTFQLAFPMSTTHFSLFVLLPRYRHTLNALMHALNGNG